MMDADDQVLDPSPSEGRMTDTPKCRIAGDPRFVVIAQADGTFAVVQGDETIVARFSLPPVSPATPKGLDFEKAELMAESVVEFGDSTIAHEPYCQADRSVASVCTCGVVEKKCQEVFRTHLNAQHLAALNGERERCAKLLEANAGASLWMRKDGEKGYREAIADLRALEAP